LPAGQSEQLTHNPVFQGMKAGLLIDVIGGGELFRVESASAKR
jgi:hypothetical protein